MSKIKTFFPVVIDSTILAAFNACPAKWFRQYCQHLNGPESTDLIAGRALARGFEVARKAYYNQEVPSHWEAVEKGAEALAETYGDHVPFKGNKTLDQMQTAFESYFAEYPMTTDQSQPARLANGQYAIEYSFAHDIGFQHPELGGPLIFVGRADMLAEFAGGLYVQDEKTTSMITASWAEQWETRGQFTAYCWGLQKDGIPVKGALIRGIGIQKTKITHIETVSHRSQFEIEAWEKMMRSSVSRMLQMYHEYRALKGTDFNVPVNHVFTPAFNEACYQYFHKCQFTDLCKSASGERFIKTEYSQNIWLPHLQSRVPLEAFLQDLLNERLLTQDAYEKL